LLDASERITACLPEFFSTFQYNANNAGPAHKVFEQRLNDIEKAPA